MPIDAFWHSILASEGMNRNLIGNSTAVMLAIINPVGLILIWSELIGDISHHQATCGLPP